MAMCKLLGALFVTVARLMTNAGAHNRTSNFQDVLQNQMELVANLNEVRPSNWLHAKSPVFDDQGSSAARCSAALWHTGT